MYYYMSFSNSGFSYRQTKLTEVVSYIFVFVYSTYLTDTVYTQT